MVDHEVPLYIWLAADYHFPSVYSCRVPLTSMSSAVALPGPGPSTVRLALIRAGLEVFGERYTRETLFPVIRSMALYIQPPERVALSNHLLRAYKGTDPSRNRHSTVEESLAYREVAHAIGMMTVYVNIPAYHEGDFFQLFSVIGYWGKSDSLAWCTDVRQQAPVVEECAKVIQACTSHEPIYNCFSTIVADFTDPYISWEQVTTSEAQAKEPILAMNIFIWPMTLIDHRNTSKLLLRRSIS